MCPIGKCYRSPECDSVSSTIVSHPFMNMIICLSAVRITEGAFQSCNLILGGGLSHLCVSDYPEAVVGARVDVKLRWHTCTYETTRILRTCIADCLNDSAQPCDVLQRYDNTDRYSSLNCNLLFCTRHSLKLSTLDRCIVLCYLKS